MNLLKGLSILISSLPAVAVILGGIYKALASLLRQFQRWLDLRESRVLARQQVAVEKALTEGFSQGYSYCLAWVYVFAVVFIFLMLVKSAPHAQA